LNPKKGISTGPVEKQSLGLLLRRIDPDPAWSCGEVVGIPQGMGFHNQAAVIDRLQLDVFPISFMSFFLRIFEPKIHIR